MNRKQVIIEIISGPQKIFSLNDEKVVSRVFVVSFAWLALAVSLWLLGASVAFRMGIGFFTANMLLWGSAFGFFSVLYLPAIHLLAGNAGDISLPDARRLVTCLNFSTTIFAAILPVSMLHAFLASRFEAAVVFLTLSFVSALYIFFIIVKVLTRRYKKNIPQSLGIIVFPLVIAGLFAVTGGSFLMFLYKTLPVFARL